MTLPLTLWTPDAFSIASQREQMLHWLFFGALMALLVYHLFLLFTVREASYLFCVILLASLILEEASYTGYLEVYFIPNLYSIKQHFYPLLFALLIAAMVIFSDTFLELRTRLPKLHWVNIVFLAGWGTLMLLTPFTSYHIIANLMAPWAVFSLLTALATGIITWRQGFKLARFFMIAWFGLLASIIMVLLVRFVITPSSFLARTFTRWE